MDGKEIEERIIRDPAILVGKPVVRGTRIPVSLIVNYVNNGRSVAELMDDFPVLTIEDIEAALAYERRRVQLLEPASRPS